MGLTLVAVTHCNGNKEVHKMKKMETEETEETPNSKDDLLMALNKGNVISLLRYCMDKYEGIWKGSARKYKTPEMNDLNELKKCVNETEVAIEQYVAGI